MDLFFELLEDPAYRHVLLNHLPITGLFVAWLAHAGASYRNRPSEIAFTLGLIAVLSASGVAIMDAGDRAYPVVYDLLDGPGQEWLDHHTLLADRYGFLLIVNALAATIGLALGLWRASLLRRAAFAVLVTTLGTIAVSSVIAEAGGKIRHPEFRLSDPPPNNAVRRD